MVQKSEECQYLLTFTRLTVFVFNISGSTLFALSSRTPCAAIATRRTIYNTIGNPVILCGITGCGCEICHYKDRIA